MDIEQQMEHHKTDDYTEHSHSYGLTLTFCRVATAFTSAPIIKCLCADKRKQCKCYMMMSGVLVARVFMGAVHLSVIDGAFN